MCMRRALRLRLCPRSIPRWSAHAGRTVSSKRTELAMASEADEARRGLSAAASALATMAMTMERIEELLASWDQRASALDGAGDIVRCVIWETAAIQLRQAIAPAAPQITAALRQRGGQ